MANETSLPRPKSLTIITFLCLVAIVLTILYFLKIYNRSPYVGSLEHQWQFIMIAIQLPIILGILFMYFLKRLGIWIFLIGKILFFGLPAMAGVDTMGLMTPIFFLESAAFFILFGKQIQYMN